MTFDALDACAVESSGSTCFDQSSFLNTAQVSSIVVEDANGDPVPGAKAISLSGVNYSLPLTTVPELSDIALVAIGLVCVYGCFTDEQKRFLVRTKRKQRLAMGQAREKRA
jgi:hypothetical protein